MCALCVLDTHTSFSPQTVKSRAVPYLPVHLRDIFYVNDLPSIQEFSLSLSRSLSHPLPSADDVFLPSPPLPLDNLLDDEETQNSKPTVTAIERTTDRNLCRATSQQEGTGITLRQERTLSELTLTLGEKMEEEGGNRGGGVREDRVLVNCVSPTSSTPAQVSSTPIDAFVDTVLGLSPLFAVTLISGAHSQPQPYENPFMTSCSSNDDSDSQSRVTPMSPMSFTSAESICTPYLSSPLTVAKCDPSYENVLISQAKTSGSGNTLIFPEVKESISGGIAPISQSLFGPSAAFTLQHTKFFRLYSLQKQLINFSLLPPSFSYDESVGVLNVERELYFEAESADGRFSSKEICKHTSQRVYGMCVDEGWKGAER